MGAKNKIVRVVFDTSTVVSALLFPRGQLTWLREHWRSGRCVSLASPATLSELVRVLAYPKFRLSAADRHELLGDYIPFCQVIERISACPVHCRDTSDQAFLDLAQSAKADRLVTSDHDLLVLAHTTRFVIQTPQDYSESLT